MNTNEALKILGLKSDYTEEELKKTYRRLIVKYHPDKFEKANIEEKKKAELKAKQINEAREILSKSKSVKKDFHNDADSKSSYDKMYEKEYELLRKLKKQYKEELGEELNYIYHINFKDKIFAECKGRLLQITKEFYNDIDNQPNTISIKINYEVYKKERFEYLCYYLYKHWKKSKVIDFVNGNLNINKSDDLKSVRSKMNMAINEILITIMKEFKSFDCYKEVEQLILAIRDGFTTLILWGYLDIKTAKNDFKNKILTELIKYNKRKQKLKELEIYFGYPTPLVIELYNNLLQEEKFNKIYNEYVTTSKKVKIKLKKIFTKQ